MGKFGWGLLIGFLATLSVGGAVLYFAWPYVASSLKILPFFKEAVEEAKARGLI